MAFLNYCYNVHNFAYEHIVIIRDDVNWSYCFPAGSDDTTINSPAWYLEEGEGMETSLISRWACPPSLPLSLASSPFACKIKESLVGVNRFNTSGSEKRHSKVICIKFILNWKLVASYFIFYAIFYWTPV